MNVSMYTLILIQSISIDFIKTIHWFVKRFMKRFIGLSNDCIYSECIDIYIYIYIYIKIITQRINQGVGSDTTCYNQTRWIP